MAWLVMLAYGVLLWLVSPPSRDRSMFYGGQSAEGQSAGFLLLTGSVLISWIFAKSITNAANLGAQYGLTGGLAYAAWYGSIPVAGVVLFAIRRRWGSDSLAEFLLEKYGRPATLAFLLAVFIRLFNEVWSNTLVVGTYFGARGSPSFYAACLVFTLITLAYSLRGGLRSSLVTDGIQVLLMVFLVVLVVGFLLPARGSRLLTAGELSLAGGVDLLLVGLLQSLSYPFHDPVLTDRGFLTDRWTTLISFLVAGGLGVLLIAGFSLVGVYAHVAGLPVGEDAPARVASALGVSALLMMNVIMMTSAGSTLDSTFSSLAREAGVDLARLTGWFTPGDLVLGRWVMVGMALLGNLPLLGGARILQATTISGTMVMGLGPIFLLGWWKRFGAISFHLSFWTGLGLGVLEVLYGVPPPLRLGTGDYAGLLGLNLYGLLACATLFLLGGVPPPRGKRDP